MVVFDALTVLGSCFVFMLVLITPVVIWGQRSVRGPTELLLIGFTSLMVWALIVTPVAVLIAAPVILLTRAGGWSTIHTALLLPLVFLAVGTILYGVVPLMFNDQNGLLRLSVGIAAIFLAFCSPLLVYLHKLLNSRARTTTILLGCCLLGLTIAGIIPR